MAFPSTFSAFNRPTSSDRLNSPSHSALHNTVSSALGQVEAVIGLSGDSSALGTLIGDARSPNSNGGGHVQTANKGGTGQTSYTKGDVLVAQSTSVLSKLAVGNNGLALIADSTTSTGVAWGVPGGSPTVAQYITASTLTWVKPSALSYIRIRAVGGGGSGDNDATNGGGGGGGGGYGEGYIPASALGANETVIIGGASPVSSVGGVTRFGTHIVCTGGNPGSGATGGTAGSVAGVYAQIKMGYNGSNARKDTVPNPDVINSGEGGGSPFGQGGSGGVTVDSGDMPGQAGKGFGAGGSGAYDGAPGVGTVGTIIIEEY